MPTRSNYYIILCIVIIPMLYAFITCQSTTSSDLSSQQPYTPEYIRDANLVDIDAFTHFLAPTSDREMKTLETSLYYTPEPYLEFEHISIKQPELNPDQTLEFTVQVKCLKPIPEEGWFNYHIYRLRDAENIMKGGYSFGDQSQTPPMKQWQVGESYSMGPIKVALTKNPAWGYYVIAGSLVYERLNDEEHPYTILTYSNPEIKNMELDYFWMPHVAGLIQEIETIRNIVNYLETQIDQSLLSRHADTFFSKELAKLSTLHETGNTLISQLKDLQSKLKTTAFPTYTDTLDSIYTAFLEWYNDCFYMQRICQISGYCKGQRDEAKQPVTMYKPENIANAIANASRYDWASEIVDQWKEDVSLIMEKDDAWLESMIPVLTPWPTYGQTCPHCAGDLSVIGETGLWQWDVKKPDEIRCKYCGTVYPNEAYTETGSITATQMKQTFTFYVNDAEKEHPESEWKEHAYKWAYWPVHTSFSGVIRYYKGQYCIDKVLVLAKLYAITKDLSYAKKAASLLRILAKRFPNWLYHSYNGTYADCPPGEAARLMGMYPPAGRFPEEKIITAFEGLHTASNGYAVLNNGFWGAGRWRCSGSDAHLIMNFTIAYDLIRNATDELGDSLFSQEAEVQIIEDLLMAGYKDSSNWDAINNKCGPTRALSGAVGVLFQNPYQVRWALDGFEQLMEHSFHFDGFCKETPSYSNMHLMLMQAIPEILYGYSDPAYYTTDAKDKLDTFNPFKEVERYKLALESMVRMLDWNMEYPVLGDTHYKTSIDPRYAEILTSYYDPSYAMLLVKVQEASLAEKGDEYALWHRNPDLPNQTLAEMELPHFTEWFPGWHVGVLRGNPDTQDGLIYFNASESGVHRHYDSLSFSYYAFGKEIVSDRGYIWDDPRNKWTKSSLSHNLVVVDDENQNEGFRRSKLELFANEPYVQVAQASALAYRQCDTYRRTLALLPLPNGSSYALDIFRVKGGINHKYCINVDGTLKSITPNQLETKDSPKTSPTSGDIADDTLSTKSTLAKEFLSNIKEMNMKAMDMKEMQGSDAVVATWSVDDTLFDAHFLKADQKILVAEAPGWRSYKGEELNAPSIHQIMLERSDLRDMNNTFVTVMEPYTKDNDPLIKEVALIDFDAATQRVVVQVTFEDHIDYLFSSVDDDVHTINGIEWQGSFAFMRFASIEAQHPTHALLVDGTRLQTSHSSISMNQARSTLKVNKIGNQSYFVAEEIPQSMQNASFCLVNETGYEICAIEGNRIDLCRYPAIDADEITLLFSESKIVEDVRENQENQENTDTTTAITNNTKEK